MSRTRLQLYGVLIFDVLAHTAAYSILYQRGIYPPESFKQVQKYGLNMLVTADEKLDEFFQKFLQQLSSKCT